MKTMLRLFLMLATVTTLVVHIGCSNSGGADAVGKTLYDQVGGEDGVTKLTNEFGASLQANPELSALLTAEAIENAKAGLANDIKKASNMSAGDMSLESALKDQKLDNNTLAGVNNAIVQAAKAMNLSGDTTDALTALIKPLAHSVIEPKL
jgi:truncated hemoglobin YjbI